MLSIYNVHIVGVQKVQMFTIVDVYKIKTGSVYKIHVMGFLLNSIRCIIFYTHSNSLFENLKKNSEKVHFNEGEECAIDLL